MEKTQDTDRVATLLDSADLLWLERRHSDALTPVVELAAANECSESTAVLKRSCCVLYREFHRRQA